MLHKRSFTYLLGTQTMSNAADVIYIMALVSLVLKGTDSIISAILVPLIRVGVQMVSGFLAPLLMVRYQLPAILFISQLGQLILFLVLASYLLLVDGDPSWLLVFGLVAGMSFFDGWTTPARNALIPRLASGDALMRANSLVSISDQIVQFAGWGLSGVLVAMLGDRTLLLAGLLYLLAMVFTSLIRDPHEAEHYLVSLRTRVADLTTLEDEIPLQQDHGARASAEGEAAADGKTKWQILREGWGIIGSTPKLVSLVFMDMIDMLGSSVWVGAFTLAFAEQVLHRGEEWWGFINAAYFAGAVGGGLIVYAIVDRVKGRLAYAMIGGMAGYGILTALYAVNAQPFLTLAIVLLMGPAAELAAVSRRTLVQQSASAQDLPKVLAAQSTLINFAFCVSLILMGWIADRFGIVNLYLFAAAMTGVAVVVGLLFRKSLAAGSLEQVNS
ncbi:MFS transporter [Paenibacillus sp. JX-17]|uniref:MFS transporter n=1 Tax=Paenibacillus lacisoli TaxID=3064525 RepID=A0ABT9CIT7_9BACL|nr:MFS transporter [Paenibacillus sp. JX-17]MDO7907857.1 MFS transporter [Paenibacillus sp. JX-17]